MLNDVMTMESATETHDCGWSQTFLLAIATESTNGVS